MSRDNFEGEESLCEMLVVVVAPCSDGEYSASHNLVLCHENNSLHLMKLPPNDLTIGWQNLNSLSHPNATLGLQSKKLEQK